VSGERILIVDDERPLLDGITHNLRQAGYHLHAATSAEEALQHLEQETYDVGIFDLMLPGMSGFDLCQKLRAQNNDMPIIMLTARDGEDDRVRGLQSGADDYIVKPFSQRELVSRVAALLRRREMDASAARRSQLIRVGDLEIDTATQQVTVRDRKVVLTPSEYVVLASLARAQGTTVPRVEIVRELWNSSHTGDERVCDVHVYAIRQKLRQVGCRQELIHTTRGIGYALRV
jgi:DNA-binding response OmpR family regulator